MPTTTAPTTADLAEVWQDHGPFLHVRMSRRCPSADGVDAVVRDTVASLTLLPCPPDDLAPELFARACERCAASAVCERARVARAAAGQTAVHDAAAEQRR